jgi:hypothetical protein
MLDPEDALRYLSLAKPSIAATKTLGRGLSDLDAPRHVPLFVVASAEDAVADPLAARDWFCRQHVTPRHLLWYSRYPDAPFPACSCKVPRRDRSEEKLSSCVTIRASSCLPPASDKAASVVASSDPAQCRSNPYRSDSRDGGGAILDLSHIGLLAAPENPRYGAEAKRNDCLHYPSSSETPERQACVGPAKGEGLSYLRYGEAGDDNLRNYVLRRLTYNPDFDHMALRIIDFLERSR